MDLRSQNMCRCILSSQSSCLSLTTYLQILVAIFSVVAYAGDPPKGGKQEPYFADDVIHGTEGSIYNISAQLSSTVYFHCRVNNLGRKTVSWLRRTSNDIPHLLTFGLATYSHDSRFQIFHEVPNDWKLQLQFTQIRDEGIYECLVSTNPPLVKKIRLNVIVPEIEIRDERNKEVVEKFYRGGSTIELKCIVEQIVGKPPEYVIWHHGDRLLNYDTERGGISVKTDLHKNGATSRLKIAKASNKDSGNYTCGMSSAFASVIVHILNGENPAAMQTGTSHRQFPAPILWIQIFLSAFQHLQVLAHFL
ncbi:zwei Ig domain protein zig-8 isoform X2 [Lepeophtheirus salmonis]|uniref:zwei Ig domain protein zig-8 isoform X2 n=1 Tax=Lepeophtheirus salmonis TaxID=72036 RepID=UPI003AF348CA